MNKYLNSRNSLRIKQLSIDGFKRSFEKANEQLCRESNESLKSKLEVKEKTDLTAEQYFNENYSGTATSEFIRPFIINSYNHGRQYRDAAIAERDEKIKELGWKV